MYKIEWAEMKAFISSNQAEFKFLEMPNDYIVVARDSWFELECYLTKTNPRNQDQIEFEDDFKALEEKLNKPMKQSSFTSKEENGLKLFTRTHGASYDLEIGSGNCDFVIPYNQVKFNALEIVGCEKGDTISLQILDSDSGIVSTVPNYMLNQFGFSVGVPDGFYVRESKYDADLFSGLKIRIMYESISAKKIHINYILHELK